MDPNQPSTQILTSMLVKLYTSAGPVTLKLYDTLLHAKGGLPEQDFFRTADAAVCFYDISKQSTYDALEGWYDAVQTHNSRKGSAPLPVSFYIFTKRHLQARATFTRQG
jgi:hypothetical protein